jgi:hypothetical protein
MSEWWRVTELLQIHNLFTYYNLHVEYSEIPSIDPDKELVGYLFSVTISDANAYNYGTDSYAVDRSEGAVGPLPGPC